MASRSDPPHAGPPDALGDLRVRSPGKVAGGLAAVTSALGFMARAGHGLRRSLKILSEVNQVGGFDCPGCAWPDPPERSWLGEYCENGAKAVAEESTTRRADAAFFQEHSVRELSTWTDHDLGSTGRLTEPLHLPEGAARYQPISWDAAIEKIASALRALASPDEAVFYTSGRTSNEAAFLYQLMVRAYGTNNLPDCSNMCHESSGVGLGETLGIGKGSVTLEDFEHADVIIVLGQNPGTNHPRMMSTLARAHERGARIVAINPLRETGLLRFSHPQRPEHLLFGGEPLTDLYLQVRLNADVPLLKALMKRLLARDAETGGRVIDHEFLGTRTEGFEALRADLDRYDLDALLDLSGVDRDAFEVVASLLDRDKRVIVCWAMGLTQHENGVDNVREVVNLLLLLGSVGKAGAGTCPVRGHSNVQGDRTMGIHEAPRPEFLDRLGAAVGFVPPRHHGLATVPAIEAMRRGDVKVFFALGGNFLSATPDTERTAEGIRAIGLTVQVSTKPNRSHLVTGREAIILPCLARSEDDVQASGPQLVSVENSMGVVHQSRGRRHPASPQLRSEVAIITHLAEALLGPKTPVDWASLRDDYDRIRDLVERAIAGFERYNERVREPGGFELPNGPRGGEFGTDTGKAKLSVCPLPDLDLPRGAFRMMTIRTHDQFNTTVYGLDDRYRGIYGERRVVLMSPEDVTEAGLYAGAAVDLVNDDGGHRRVASRFAVVPYDIPRRCVATYFPEANVLVPLERRARGSLTPASKSVVIRIEPRDD